MLSDATVGVAYVDPHGLCEPAKHSHGSKKVSLALGAELADSMGLSVSIG